MFAPSPNCEARSSLEVMLDCLRQKDENETPTYLPPTLPPRPSSRARLPSIKRPLPTSSEDDETGAAQNSLTFCVEGGKTKGRTGNTFGAKKVKEMTAGESPYVEHSQRFEEKDNANLANLPPESLSRFRDSAWEDSVGYFIKKKLLVWCRLQSGLWGSGLIKSTSEENASVLLLDGSVVTVPRLELLPGNPEILDGVDDLVKLSYLNEPSVLHNLQFRYSQDIIYSKVGPVLVSFNPFKDVHIYGSDSITAYRKKLLDSPHVYAVADTAYNAMMIDEVNQSIILSGESGSGKTEAAKTAMQYLAAVGGGGIEYKVMQTSCILEAFGNAKTAKNDNSSRFGKLIDIHFSDTGQICGAKIQSFQLEKSRVVQLHQGERSYHVLYQLCSGAPSSLRGKLRLKRASEYNYLNQGGCLEIDNVNDTQKFHILMGALNNIEICKKDLEHVFEILAAVLWLGNISFLVTDNQNHIEVVADEAVTNAAYQMGCSEQDLMLTLSTRKIQSRNDEVTERLTLEQVDNIKDSLSPDKQTMSALNKYFMRAIDTRDALAKFMYASLFDWLVQRINSSLARSEHNTGRCISILEICGFESFKNNNFEQLCINYANERLQQHFIRHLFKLEQEEYELEGIDWKKVDFEDNQDCLDLFEKKSTGLISLLDEESNFPGATDLTFVTKLRQHLNANPCFRGERGGTFTVRHYAGEVLYDTGGFLEKNRDQLHLETIQLLLSCTNVLPQYFVSTLLNQSHNPSDATKFKGQLFKLMQHLESTTPHFIHCVRPNNKQIPSVFEKDLALEQLRCYGILDVARISRSGYPTRMAHQEFTRRYEFLLPERVAFEDPLSVSIAILRHFDVPQEMYHVGYTKLYFRAGQIDVLEDVRNRVLQGTAEVQKSFPEYPDCQDLQELKDVVMTLQSYVRGEIARKEYRALLGLKTKVTQENSNEQIMAVVQLQSVIRGWLAQRHFSHLRNLKRSKVLKQIPHKRTSEVKDLPPEFLPIVVEELQKRASMAVAALGRKEKENEALIEQVQQYKAQWSDFEAKMKSMETTWQKEMTSLQMNLAAAEKSLAAVNTRSHAGRPDGGINPVGHLVEEFEQKKQSFDDEAQAIIEVKSEHSLSQTPIEDFHRLKNTFKAWKKDYKVRLREAKAKIQMVVPIEAGKHRRKWWGVKSWR